MADRTELALYAHRASWHCLHTADVGGSTVLLLLKQMFQELGLQGGKFILATGQALATLAGKSHASMYDFISFFILEDLLD